MNDERTLLNACSIKNLHQQDFQEEDFSKWKEILSGDWEGVTNYILKNPKGEQYSVSLSSKEEDILWL